MVIVQVIKIIVDVEVYVCEVVIKVDGVLQLKFDVLIVINKVWVEVVVQVFVFSVMLGVGVNGVVSCQDEIGQLMGVLVIKVVCDLVFDFKVKD